MSENELSESEWSSRESFIPFDAFTHAFLWRRPEDLTTAQEIQQSVGFQQPLQRFLELADPSENNDVYAPLVQLMNHVITEEHNAQLARGAPVELLLEFTHTTGTQGIVNSLGVLQQPHMWGVQALAGIGWKSVLVACEYKSCLPSQLLPGTSTPTSTLTTATVSLSDTRHLLPHLPNHSGASRIRSSYYSHSGRSSGTYTSGSQQEMGLDGYLLEMRSRQATRESVLGILFTSTYASFWYADSDSTIKSQPIPVGSPDFITALICLARASPEKLGYSSRFRAVDCSIITHQSIAGARFTTSEELSENVTYNLTDEISLAHMLHGRCTRVLGANLPSSQERCVLKFSYQITGCEEAMLIQQAHENGVTGVVRLHGFFTLKKLSEGPRSRLPPGLIPGKPSHLLVEDRELRVLVLARCMPLYLVSDPKDFLAASISLLNIICDLYEKAGILHRDISANNLMVEENNPSAGVLIDLDRASDPISRDKNAPSLHRTGTLPFMALDLLHDDGDCQQYLRHDMESFVYVLCWIAGRYDSGIEVDKLQFHDWYEGDWKTILSAKLLFLSGMSWNDIQPTPAFEFLGEAISEFQGVFFN